MEGKAGSQAGQRGHAAKADCTARRWGPRVCRLWHKTQRPQANALPQHKLQCTAKEDQATTRSCCKGGGRWRFGGSFCRECSKDATDFQQTYSRAADAYQGLSCHSHATHANRGDDGNIALRTHDGLGAVGVPQAVGSCEARTTGGQVS